MTLSLMPLPFALDALEPAISADTLSVHHGKHHKAYVDKTNALIAGTDFEDKPLEAIIASARDGAQTVLFNQAAQVWNHGFYWHSLAPAATVPSPALAKAIDAAFGSQEKLEEEMIAQGLGHFGSGWAWLVSTTGGLKVTTTHDAELPGGDGEVALLVVDVWEHAYYLDRKNDRKAYVAAVIGKLNWDFASDLFDRGEPWIYPG